MCPTLTPDMLPTSIELAVTIDCEGSVENVVVVQGISEECDALVLDAMWPVRFTPAEVVPGQLAAVTIKWEWIFAR